MFVCVCLLVSLKLLFAHKPMTLTGRGVEGKFFHIKNFNLFHYCSLVSLPVPLALHHWILYRFLLEILKFNWHSHAQTDRTRRIRHARTSTQPERCIKWWKNNNNNMKNQPRTNNNKNYQASFLHSQPDPDFYQIGKHTTLFGQILVLVLLQ